MAKRNIGAGASVLDRSILWPAIGQAFAKLDPRKLARNPVMFVVAIVAAATTLLFIRDIAAGADNLLFSFQIILWLWFTVLFANFAEAVAEGRGKAQAESLRQTKEELKAKLFIDEPKGVWIPVSATELVPGNVVLVEAGDVIPSDGEVI
jgi:K+-transporting ATPase ATPase B chain